jgi:hypothetical protein
MSILVAPSTPPHTLVHTATHTWACSPSHSSSKYCNAWRPSSIIAADASASVCARVCVYVCAYTCVCVCECVCMCSCVWKHGHSYVISTFSGLARTCVQGWPEPHKKQHQAILVFFRPYTFSIARAWYACTIPKVGQKRIYAPYMIVCMVISMLKYVYTYNYMVLAHPNITACAYFTVTCRFVWAAPFIWTHAGVFLH